MAVIPRPASTVVLMDDKSRVYLTKRPKTMKFFGGFYVFPGGAVEKSDLEIDHEYIKQKEPMESFDSAYYVAAARELFEEVGILLCTNGSGLSVPLEQEAEMEYRRQLIQGELSFSQMLKKEGMHLNLENLTFFGQLTTPERNPIRFETHFFLAQLPDGQLPNPDLSEIDEASWFTPEEAISAFQNGEISLGPPTILALTAISDHQKGKPLRMPDLEAYLAEKGLRF
jgi:8-oxo-dGTP pyrophosphatase MutT (NUDIX family)